MKNINLWLAGTALTLNVLVPVVGAHANPLGGVVTGGDANATITGQGTNVVTVDQTANKAIIDWNSFNLAAGDTTNFNQHTGASAVTLNRIHDANPSQVFGTITAPGTVMLINSNGIMFGQGSKVDVGSLVATTNDINNDTFNNTTGSSYHFDGTAGKAGSVVQNNGEIDVKAGGIAALVAPSVVNNGMINAKMAKVSLAGGEKFTVDLMGDGLVNLEVPTQGSGKVTQGSTGKIMADAGTVQLTAKSAANLVDSLVNVDGIVQAATVASVNGKIVLAADNATVAQTTSDNANAAEVDVKNATGTTSLDVNAGIKLAGTNGHVNLDAGTYNNGEIFVNKTGVQVNGTGAGTTKLNVTSPGGFGVLMTADNSQLNNLTVNGVNGTQNPIKVTGNVQAAGANLPYVTGVQVNNVAVTTDGAGKVKSMIDVNGASNLALTNVNVTGHGSFAGIAITDSNNTALQNITTSGNGYGIALQTAGTFAPGGINGVTLTGTNSLGEDVALLTSVSNGYKVTNVTAPDLKFETNSSGLTTAGYAYYSTNQTSGLNVALGQAKTDQSTVLQYLDTGAATLTGKNEFLVGNNGTTQMSIQAAADAAKTGGIIDLQTGTYDLSKYANNYLFLTTNGLTINGAGLGNTFLNGSNDSTYGVRIQADNVTLNNFNLNGPAKQTAGSSQEYGIKAEVGAATGATLDNLTLNNISVAGAGKTQIDLNTTTGASFNNVTTTGNGVRGAGLFLTDSDNVTLNGIHTSNNAWGGVAESANNQDVAGLTVTGSNSFGESNPLYTEVANGHSVSGLKLGTTFTDVVHDNSDAAHTYYQTSQANAVTYAGTKNAASTYIEGLATDAMTALTTVNNMFYVPTSLQIQTAIDAATDDGTGVVNVLAGNFHLNSALNLNKSISVQGAGDGVTNIDGSSVSGYPINITADNTKLGGFYLYAAGNATGGVSVAGTMANPTVNNVALSNFDVNGTTDGNKVSIANADGVTVDGVRAFGNNKNGAGIAITDSKNVTLTHDYTQDNLSGGLLLTANSADSVDHISIDGSNTFTEQMPVVLVDNSPLHNGFGSVSLPAFTYELADGAHTYYQTSYASGLALANSMMLPEQAQTYFEGLVTANGSTTGNNQFYVPVSLQIQTAIDAAADGGVSHIQVLDGTHQLASTLNVDKQLTVQGTGNNTILDTSKITGDGVKITASGVGFRDMAIQTVGANSHAVEIAATLGDGTNYTGNQLANLTITGGTTSDAVVDSKGGYDSMYSVNVDGTRADGTAATGAAIALNDVSNFQIYNEVTSNNAAGLVLTANTGASNISVGNSNQFGEANPVEVINNTGSALSGLLIGGNTDKGNNYAGSQAAAYTAELADGTHTYYQSNVANAETYAANVATPASTYLEGLTTDSHGNVNGTDNQFYVPTALQIQTAIDAANGDGTGVVNVLAGNFKLNSALNLNKSISVQGAGDGTTNIDGANVNGYPITITADNTKLGGFYLSARGYNTGGVSVAGTTTNPTVNNVTLSNFDVDGTTSGDKVSIANADGVSVNSVRAFGSNYGGGAGFGITDSSNVALNNVMTSGNLDGGVVLTASQNGGGIHNVAVGNSNNLGEANPLETIDNGGGISVADNQFGGYTGTDANYMGSKAPAYTAELADGTHTYYQANVASAETYAANVANPASTYLEGLTNNANGNVNGTDNEFYVPTNLQIQTAIDAADPSTHSDVNLLAGTFKLATTLDINKYTYVKGANGATTLDTSAIDGDGVLITAAGGSLRDVAITTGGANSHAVEIATGADGTTYTGNQLANLTITGGTTGDAVVDSKGNGDTMYSVNVDGTRADGTAATGVAIALNDVSNFAIYNEVTSNNAAGLILTANTGASNVSIGNSNQFAEANPVEVINNTGTPLTGLLIGGNTDQASNYAGSQTPAYTYELADGTRTYYQTNLTNAETYAANVASPASTYLEGLTTDTHGNVNGVNNTFYVPTALKIQPAVNQATDGATVNVLAGAHTENNTIEIGKSLTLKGAGNGSGAGDTQITSLEQGGYGIHVTGNDVTLEHFLLNGPASNDKTQADYGIKVEPATLTATDQVLNTVLRDLTVQGSGRTNVDLAGAKNATIKNVTALNSTYGAGLSITNSHNVQITGLNTSGNSFGGVLIQSNDTSPYTPGTSNISIDAGSKLAEANQLYTEDDAGTITDLKLGGFNYVLHNDALAPNDNFYQQTQKGAVAFSGLLPNTDNDTTIEGLMTKKNGAVTGNNTWYVPTNLTIQTAVDAATSGGIIDLFKGIYDQAVNITKALTVNGKGSGFNNGTVIAAGTSDEGQANYGIRVAANGVTLSDLAVDGTNTNNSIVITPNDEEGTIANVTLSNVKTRNANQSNILINDADGVTLNSVAARNSINGEGLEIDNSSNVALNDVQTRGNAGGGVLVQAQTRNSDDVTIDNASTFREALPLVSQQSLDTNGVKVTDLTPGRYIYTVNNPQYDQSVGQKVTFYFDTQAKADQKADQLATDFPAPANGNGLFDDAATRETTRRASRGPGTGQVADLGTGSVFDFLEPAEGGDDKKDISQQPLASDQIAVGQYFLEDGQVTSGANALQTLLARDGGKAK